MASSSSTLFVPAFTELRSDEYYNYRNTSCQLKVIRSNEYHKVYIGFHKFTSYQDTTTSETQHSQLRESTTGGCRQTDQVPR